MKNPIKPNIFPWFTMGVGGLGLALRVWFFAGLDEKGLLPAKHPSLALVFILMALVLGVLLLCVRQLPPIHKYSRLFPAKVSRSVGCAIGAAGVLYGGIYYLLPGGGLGVVTFIVSIAATAAMLFLAILRKTGSRPSMALYTAQTVFFILFLVCNCRLWGAEPQIQSYIFPLFACVFLMLHAYHNTALAVRKGGRQWLVFSNQAALFFCCLSLCGKNRFFYLTMILYLFLDLCSLRIDRQPEEA